jgi:hypothetical protein
VGVPHQLAVVGSATLGPIQPTSCPFPSGTSSISLNTTQTRQAARADSLSFNVPSPSWQSLIAGLGITAVRFLVIRVQSGSILVRVTSASGGALQVLPVSDYIVLSLPRAGTELTVVEAQGTANMELIVAGDP